MDKPLKVETLRLLLSYDPESGKLHWLYRDASLFTGKGRGGAAGNAARWNSRYAGTEAFTAISTDGYKHGCIFGKSIGAHRVVWAWWHGEWPRLEIDHINGDPADNRIKNLRLVTGSQNCRNRRLRSDSTSGVTGVSWNIRLRKWVAHIGREGCALRHVGVFVSLEEAVAARKAAETAEGYHPNHGRPA